MEIKIVKTNIKVIMMIITIITKITTKNIFKNKNTTLVSNICNFYPQNVTVL